MIRLEELFDEVRNYCWTAYDCGVSPHSSMCKEYLASCEQRINSHITSIYNEQDPKVIVFNDLMQLISEMSNAFYRYGNDESGTNGYIALEQRENVLCKLAEIYREIYSGE